MAKIIECEIYFEDSDCGESMGEEQKTFNVGCDMYFNFELDKTLPSPVKDDDFTSLDSKEYEDIMTKIKSEKFEQYVKDYFK